MTQQPMVRRTAAQVCAAATDEQKPVLTLLRSVWIIFLLQLCSPMLHAQDYDVDVAINGKTASEEFVAYRTAMRIVILRESRRTGGSSDVFEREDIQEALRSAENWVLQVSSRSFAATDELTERVAKTRSVRDSGVATHWLTVGFASDSIVQLVASGQEIQGTVPSVSTENPAEPAPQSALLWMLIVDGERSILIGGDSGTNIMDRAREIAGGVGYTTYFPTLDLDDTQAVSPDTLQTDNQAVLLSASERYGQPVVVSAILTREQGRRWNTRWNRYFNDTVTEQSFTAPSLDRALQQGVGWLTGAGGVDPVLSRTSPGTTNQTISRGTNTFSAGGNALTPGESLIWVGGVSTTERYANLVGMIGDIEGARVIYPKEVNQSGVLLGVQPQSAAQAVASRLARSGVIRQNSVRPLTAAGALAARADIVMQYDQ